MKWSAVCCDAAQGLPAGDPTFTAWARLAVTPVREIKSIVDPRDRDGRGGRGRGGRRGAAAAVAAAATARGATAVARIADTPAPRTCASTAATVLSNPASASST